MTESVEDYLKAIYILGEQGETTTVGIAGRLGVASPSVSAMVKRLAAADLLARGPGRGLSLTDHGRRHALHVLRRHRLLETYLVQELGVPWDEVHEEAEVLEHVLSARLESRIDAVLGHPTHDPHGDPIPPRDGPHEEGWGDPLAAAPVGTAFLVERVSDADAGALRHLGDLGIVPGVAVQVLRQDPYGGPLWVEVDGQQLALGGPLTRLVHGRSIV